MIRSAIVDAEKAGRKRLRNLLKTHCPQIEVVGTAEGVSDGIQLLTKKRPGLLFLDIKIPDGNGFEILKKVRDPDLQVIFTSASDQYALEAIKFNVLDYLLKPIQEPDLIQAISKLHEMPFRVNQGKPSFPDRMAYAGLGKLAIPSNSTILYIPTDNILYCEASGNYTYFYLKDGSKVVSSKLLKEYEKLLERSLFFRVHRSYLVNLKYVRAFRRNETEEVEMEGGFTVEVSRKKKTDFLKTMEAIL